MGISNTGYANDTSAHRAAQNEIRRLMGPNHAIARDVDYSIKRRPETGRYYVTITGEPLKRSKEPMVPIQLRKFDTDTGEWTDVLDGNGKPVIVQGTMGVVGWMNTVCNLEHRWFAT